MQLGHLARALGATLRGKPNVQIHRIMPPAQAGPDDLCAVLSSRFLSAAHNSSAAAFLIAPAFENKLPPGVPLIICQTPRAAFGKAIRLLSPGPALAAPAVGVHPSSVVDPSAQVHSGARIGPLVCIGAHAIIHDAVQIHAGAVVGQRVEIGRGATLAPRAVVLDGCQVGESAWIGAGAVIGEIGFGLDAEGRLPHSGRVTIGDRVTIGANSCVDRGTLGDTSIAADAHLDNLVQVGHNAQIGEGAILCGQVGIAGGAHVGKGVVLGGQSGVNGDVNIGAMARIAAQSGVTRHLKAGGQYSGHPAEPNRVRLRRWARLKRLAET